MSETQEETAASKPAAEGKHFVDILRSLVGRTVTVVNAESYEEAPVGHTLKAGFYRAKITGIGRDYLVLLTEFKHVKKKEQASEPVKQFLPFTRVKRVSLMKSDCMLHI